MSQYTKDYEPGDLVTERKGGGHTMRVQKVLGDFTVEVVPASEVHGKQAVIRDISGLRNMTKGDPL